MLAIEGLRSDLVGPVDLAVAPGECVTIEGPSGCGKTRFLRAIVDLDPNRGRVRLDDRRREAMPAWRWRRLVGMVPAESGWWADRVGEHFERPEALPPLLEALGLPPDSPDWEVSRLSSGERHRLAIARALCLEPQALLLDEPTASLDAAATARVEALLRRFQRSRRPLMIVTHDPEQARRLGARRLAMREGRLSAMVEAPS
ncbi:MAG TPA: ABC transporter ATP-binding protein [Rhodospirillales bacterium]|nr:ABC transporter ATP-binding protein [Rhodospirillales bacterium]